MSTSTYEEQLLQHPDWADVPETKEMSSIIGISEAEIRQRNSLRRRERQLDILISNVKESANALEATLAQTKSVLEGLGGKGESNQAISDQKFSMLSGLVEGVSCSVKQISDRSERSGDQVESNKTLSDHKFSMMNGLVDQISCSLQQLSDKTEHAADKDVLNQAVIDLRNLAGAMCETQTRAGQLSLSKARIGAVVATDDATTPETTMALVNELKGVLNVMNALT